MPAASRPAPPLPHGEQGICGAAGNAALGGHRELARLRWRCRRGLLENDLILARFLDARGEALTFDEIAALDRLLDLADTELWDLLAGRIEPPDAGLRPLLAELRAA